MGTQYFRKQDKIYEYVMISLPGHWYPPIVTTKTVTPLNSWVNAWLSEWRTKKFYEEVRSWKDVATKYDTLLLSALNRTPILIYNPLSYHNTFTVDISNYTQKKNKRYIIGFELNLEHKIHFRLKFTFCVCFF